MKKTVEQIEESKIEIHIKTTYTCDVVGCKYETDSEFGAVEHEGKHASKDHRCIGDIDFHWFDTGEDMSKWLTAQRRSYRHDFAHGNFIGPGWYGADLEEMGSCGDIDHGINLLPFREFRTRWEAQITELEHNVDMLNAEMEDTE
jgi:hypothetical protein